MNAHQKIQALRAYFENNLQEASFPIGDRCIVTALNKLEQNYVCAIEVPSLHIPVIVIHEDGTDEGVLREDDSITIQAATHKDAAIEPGDAGVYTLWENLPGSDYKNCVSIITGIPKGVTRNTLMGVLLMSGFATKRDELKPDEEGTDAPELPWHIITEECREMERGRRGRMVNVVIEYRMTAKFTLPGNASTIDDYMQFFPVPVKQMMQLSDTTWECRSAEEVDPR